jgi:hypothetical protein
MNVLLFLGQMKRNMWSLYKLGRIVAFVGLLYQIISVTISYLEYETVIDMKAILNKKGRPTLTFCLYSDREFPKRTKNPAMQQTFGHSFGCSLVFANLTNKQFKCSHLSKLVESVTPFSRRCISLYSHLLDEKLMPTNETHYVTIDNTLKIFALIHQSGTPPHFTGNKIEIIDSSINTIDHSSIITQLLPFPHSTDCYDYRKEAKLAYGYNSREDCVVKHLEGEEFAKCGCNKRWAYRAYDKRNFSHICPQSIKCDFDSKFQIKSLDKVCKNNCYNEYYFNQFNSFQFTYENEVDDLKELYIQKSPKYEIVFTYLPKMDLVEYLCSIGGLVSMWFGISVYNLALLLVNESKKWLIRIFSSINYEILAIIVFKFKEMISKKFDGILSKLTMIAFSMLMLYQIFGVIAIYLKFEIVTRFEVQEIMVLPRIQFAKQPMASNFDELIKIYPDMKHKIANFDGEGKQQIFDEGLRQLILDNRFNDFERIAETEKYFKTCHFVINNKLINCSKGNIGVFDAYPFLLIINDLTYSGIEDKSKVQKISLSLNPFQLFLTFLYSSHVTKVLFKPQVNTRTKLTFSSFSVRKLNSIHNECISDEELKTFEEHYFDFILTDCYFKSLNESYGCIYFTRVTIYFDRDILRNGYKLCKNSSLNVDRSNKIIKECSKLLTPICNSTNLNVKFETTKLLSNETIVEIIPKKIPSIAYIETYKTDFDRFIYNFGGVIGLWFGLTPVEFVNILQNLPLISNTLICKSIKFVHYIKAISIRFAQNSYEVCKRFGIYLLGIGVRFAQNVITICKRIGIHLLGISVRFAQNVITICKRIGIYLLRINVRFAQNVITICKRFVLFFTANIITLAYNLIVTLMRFFRHLFPIN